MKPACRRRQNHAPSTHPMYILHDHHSVPPRWMRYGREAKTARHKMPLALSGRGKRRRRGPIQDAYPEAPSSGAEAHGLSLRGSLTFLPYVKPSSQACSSTNAAALLSSGAAWPATMILCGRRWGACVEVGCSPQREGRVVATEQWAQGAASPETAFATILAA